MNRMKKGRVLLTCLIACSAATSTLAQNGIKANHVALYVNDLKKSADFYEHVLQLKEIPEPFHDGKHVWLRTGEHSQLHLIQGAAGITQHDINSHFSYSVNNLADFTKRLDEMHIKYGNWKQTSTSPELRPDGVKQVYFQDPDNYWIEINDDKF
ncbi:MAG TPA: VOC family protein [Mucilaginibacter sp.]|nr:VOC family protein [Mucilaginibacter sp.]